MSERPRSSEAGWSWGVEARLALSNYREKEKLRRRRTMIASARSTPYQDPYVMRVSELLDILTPKSTLMIPRNPPINEYYPEFEMELRAIAETKSSSFESELVFNYIHLGNVSGKTILELGSGASNASLSLREQGALTFSVDYRYRDLRSLAQEVTEFNHNTYSARNGLDPKTYQELSARLGMNGPGILNMFPIVDADVKSRAQERYETQMQTLIKFLESIPENKWFNIAALFGTLPFADSVFDDAFSYLALSNTQVHRPAQFMRSVKECGRVLKPGRKLQIAPWGPDAIPNDKNLQYQNQVIALLESEGIPYNYKPILRQSGTLILF